MKNLNINQKIGIFVSLGVIAIFFVVGNLFFSSKIGNDMKNQPTVSFSDNIFGEGDVALAGKTVTIDYVGKFVDGSVFDSSTGGSPLTFILGQKQVIDGLDQGIVGMKVGGKRIITVPPELGYGYQDYGPIGAGSTLVFEITLLKVE